MRKAMAIVLTAGAMFASGVVPAAANEDDVIQRGSCSGRTDWKLKASPEDRGIEVEFEVDQNVVGDDWRVRIFQDGERIFSGVRKTRGASGSSRSGSWRTTVPEPTDSSAGLGTCRPKRPAAAPSRSERRARGAGRSAGAPPALEGV